MNKAEPFEFTEREIIALAQENNGNRYKRQHLISELAFDAMLTASQKVLPLCSFKNKHGWCKLEEGHGGSHTVINLGDD